MSQASVIIIVFILIIPALAGVVMAGQLGKRLDCAHRQTAGAKDTIRILEQERDQAREDLKKVKAAADLAVYAEGERVARGLDSHIKQVTAERDALKARLDAEIDENRRHGAALSNSYEAKLATARAEVERLKQAAAEHRTRIIHAINAHAADVNDPCRVQ